MNNVEESFPKSRIHSFLKDITELCKKYKASIYMYEIEERFTIVLNFTEGERFVEFEADSLSSSVYWPKIETHITHRRIS